MRSRFGLVTLLGLVLSGAVLHPASGQSFAGSGEAAEFAGASSSSNSTDNALYNAGMRAINDTRWANAEAIFTTVADQHNDRSEGALYWKSYAQKKQGHSKAALETC